MPQGQEKSWDLGQPQREAAVWLLGRVDVGSWARTSLSGKTTQLGTRSFLFRCSSLLSLTSLVCGKTEDVGEFAEAP